MKTFALLLALFSFSCASSNDDFLAKDAETCEPGSEIELAAGMADMEQLGAGRMVALVEVANNSNRDFTVKSVRVDPAQRNSGRLEIQGGAREFGTEIPHGESETFEVPLFFTMKNNMDRMPRGATVPFEASVAVTLADGSSARCRFVLTARF